MKCIVCKKSIAFMVDKSRKVFYCSERCRSKYYHDKDTIKQIERGDFYDLTIARLEELGYQIRIEGVKANSQL